MQNGMQRPMPGMPMPGFQAMPHMPQGMVMNAGGPHMSPAMANQHVPGMMNMNIPQNINQVRIPPATHLYSLIANTSRSIARTCATCTRSRGALVRLVRCLI